MRDPFYIGIGVCSHDKDVIEKAVFSNVEIATPTASAAPAVLYSTLETVTISSTDRRVVYVAPTHFEAPNWSHDGTYFLFNSDGHILRLPVDGGTPTTHRHRLRHPLQQRPRHLARRDSGWRSATSRRPTASRVSTSCRSRAERLAASRRIRRRTGTAGRPTARRSPSAASAMASSTSTRFPSAGGDETRLTTAKGLDDGPEYSPDGKYIYFNSERTGRMQIWRMNPDGSAQEQVTYDEFNNWFPHISPDGKSMVFLSYEKDVTGHPANKDVQLRLMTLSDGRSRSSPKSLADRARSTSRPGRPTARSPSSAINCFQLKNRQQNDKSPHFQQ